MRERKAPFLLGAVYSRSQCWPTRVVSPGGLAANPQELSVPCRGASSMLAPLSGSWGMRGRPTMWPPREVRLPSEVRQNHPGWQNMHTSCPPISLALRCLVLTSGCSFLSAPTPQPTSALRFFSPLPTAGVIALTKTVAREYAARGIVANTVAPGFIDTGMQELQAEDQPAGPAGSTG